MDTRGLATRPNTDPQSIPLAMSAKFKSSLQENMMNDTS
jgi:hypothetical protein